MTSSHSPEIIPTTELFTFAALQVETGLPDQSKYPNARATYERWAHIGRAVGRMVAGDPYAERDARATLTAAAENLRLVERVSALFYAANYDSLTGLENRAYFETNLDQRLELAHNNGEPAGSFAVIALDLDGFKDVNDTYGHPMGDKVLTVIGGAIARGLRRTDRAARIRGRSVTEGPEQPLSTDGDTEQLHISRHGGDEFLVLVETNEPPRRSRRALTPERQAILVGHRIRRAIEEAAADKELGIDTFVSTSVGIALYRPGLTRGDLLTQADIALYGSKSHKLTPEKPIVIMGSHGQTEERSTKRYPDRRNQASQR